VTIEPTELHRRKDPHLEALKAQIARCLEKKLSLAAEERRERAKRLGIDWKIAERPKRPNKSGSSAAVAGAFSLVGCSFFAFLDWMQTIKRTTSTIVPSGPHPARASEAHSPPHRRQSKRPIFAPDTSRCRSKRR
jgi:hypothetical protein